MSNEQKELLSEVYENYVKWWEESDDSCNLTEEQYSKWLKLVDGGLQWAPLTKEEFINKCKTETEFSKKWGLKIEERELNLEERLPKKIKLTGHGDVMEFSLTDKRELNYYGRTKESNESKWRTEKLKDNEVFYETEFGWGVFLNTDTFETVTYDGTEWGGHKLNDPTKLITVTRELSEEEIWDYIHKNKIEILHEHAVLYGHAVGSEYRKSFIPTLIVHYNIPTKETIESYESN